MRTNRSAGASAIPLSIRWGFSLPSSRRPPVSKAAMGPSICWRSSGVTFRAYSWYGWMARMPVTSSPEYGRCGPNGKSTCRLSSGPPVSRVSRCSRNAGLSRGATYTTPIQTTVSYPIIGLTGLLHLVTVVDKFRPQAVEEKGSVCRPPSSPPAHRAQRAHPVVDAAARGESPTPPVAAQPAAGAPAERRSRAGGGRR